MRSLHRPGAPLLLPNAWDVASARAVVAAGFPVVATTSWGVAATLGHEDHADAPADDMLGAAARIARDVEVPVTVDAEAGYRMEPARLVAVLRGAGFAGCNLEDTDHATGSLRDPDQQAEWLREVREAASKQGYRLVINARVDVFFEPWLAGAGSQEELVPDALRRANAYLEAGVDCVYPIVLWERHALESFMSQVSGAVNVVRLPETPSHAELAALGVARVSWGPLLFRETMASSRSGSRRYGNEPRRHRGARFRLDRSVRPGPRSQLRCLQSEASPAGTGADRGKYFLTHQVPAKIYTGA